MPDSNITVPRLIIECIICVGLTVGASALAQPWLSLSNLAFLFLVPVIVVAGKRGLAGGLATALLAMLGFNFFFVPPAYTLHVADVDNLVTLLVLALTATLVSQVASRLKAQAMRAEALAQISDRLASFTQDLAAGADEQAVLSIAEDRIEHWTGAKLSFVDPDKDDALSPLDEAAARWALAHKVESGRGTDVMAGADAIYIPIEGSSVPLVVQLWRATGAAPIRTDNRELVRQALARTGVALHRVTVNARLQHEAMREAVLASIGHDLRTPLTGVVAGLAALSTDADGIVESTRTQAARLERLVSNILDLARLRSNALTQEREAIDLTDAIDSVLSALASRLSGHKLAVDLSPDMPLVRSDARMLHHMLLNLLDNAAKFSEPGSTILIEGKSLQDGVRLTIADEGRGLADVETGLPKRDWSDPTPGSGLGLTVVSGFAAALGLKFEAANRADGKRGAIMALIFPLEQCIIPAGETM